MQTAVDRLADDFPAFTSKDGREITLKTRRCFICNVSFRKASSSARATCSRKCKSLLMSKLLTGRGNPAWRGGRNVDAEGYVRVMAKGNRHADINGYVKEHILVMEKHIGREMSPGEIVHHIDHDKKNNSVSNLRMEKREDHARYHALKRWGKM